MVRDFSVGKMVIFFVSLEEQCEASWRVSTADDGRSETPRKRDNVRFMD